METLAPRVGVEPVLRELGVAKSTYYAWCSRTASTREVRDDEIVEAIGRIRTGFRRVYGVRKTWRSLTRDGVVVGRGRVARLMRREGLRGVQRGRFRVTTTPDETAADGARDLVRRQFTASEPNQLWVADFTYVGTWEGVGYFAFVLDVFSRRVVGWQLKRHMKTDLVLDALEMAGGLRKPRPGLVAHNDRGSQYTSLAYTTRLLEIGAAPSVGSVGDALDNAMAESFVATYKSELIDQFGPWRTINELINETTSWTGFYNHERLHESLKDVPPVEYELDWLARIRDNHHGQEQDHRLAG